MAKLYRYAAFISYSSQDAGFAAKLHAALERYGIPATLGPIDLLGQGGKKNRIYPVFRDREELPAGNLTEEIEAALDASNSLIVICSPAAAKSQWVAKEIDFFAAAGRRDRIFAIIPPNAPVEINGRDATADCLPSKLRAGIGAADSFELLAADARAGKDEFRTACLKLVAGMIKVKVGELVDRDRKRRRIAAFRNAAILLTFVVALAVVWQVGAAWRASAIRDEHASNAQTLAERSRAAKRAHQNGLALTLAAQSLFESSLAERAPVDVGLFTSIVAPTRLRLSRRISNSVSHWAVSPSQRALAVHSNGGVSIVDLDTGRTTGTVGIGATNVGAIAFVDDRRLAVGDRDGRLAIYDLAGRSSSATALAPEPIVAIAANAAANVMVVATSRRIIELELSTQRALAERPTQGRTIQRLAIDPIGRKLAAAANDNSVQRWSLGGLVPEAARSYRQSPQAITFARQGQLMLVATWDRAIHLVDARSGTDTAVLRAQGSAVQAMDVSPDGRLLITGDRDGLSHLWDLDAAQVMDLPGPRIGPVMMARFLPGGDRLAILDGNGLLRIWNVAQPAEVRTIRAHDGAVRGVFFLPDDLRILSASDDGMIRIWNAETGQMLAERNGGIGPIVASALAPDGTTFAIGGSNGTIALWDIAGLRRVAMFQGHDNRIPALDFVAGGQLLASASWDGTIALWDVRTRSLVRRIAASQRELTGLASSPDGKFLASTGLDGKLRTFDTSDGRRIAVHEDTAGFLRVVRFNPDGSILAAAGKSGIIHLVRPPQLTGLAELRGWTGEAWALSPSPDGRFLALGSRSDGDYQTLQLWGLPGQRLLARLNAHYEFTLSVRFSRTGSRFVTGGDDGLIKIWSMRKLAALANAERGTATARLHRYALDPASANREALAALVQTARAQSGFGREVPVR